MRVTDIAFITWFENRPTCLRAYIFSRSWGFQTNEWGYLDYRFHSPDYEDEALIDLDDLPWEYQDEYGEPDPVGWNYELHIDKIAENPKLYDGVRRLLTSGDNCY